MSGSTRNAHILTLLRIFSLPNAIIIYHKYEKFEKPYILSFLTFSFIVACFALNAFFIENITRVDFMEIIYANNAIVNVIAVFCVNQILKPRYKSMYRKIQLQCSNNLFISSSNKYCNEMINNYKWIMPIIYFTVNALPVVIIIFTDTKIGDLKALVFPSWYPWDSRVKWKYVLTIIMQLVCTTLGYVSVMCSIAILICYTAAIRAHCDIFKSDMEDCFKFDEILIAKRKFIQVIRRHQNLMEFTREVEELSSYVAVFTTMIFFITFVSLTSMYVQVPDDYLFNLKLISASIFSTIFFFWSCSIGDMLSTVNIRINRNLYETSWYKKDIEIQKMTLLFFTQNQKQFKLKIFNLYWINLSFFLHVIKICYSVIQLLTS